MFAVQGKESFVESARGVGFRGWAWVRVVEEQEEGAMAGDMDSRPPRRVTGCSTSAVGLPLLRRSLRPSAAVASHGALAD